MKKRPVTYSSRSSGPRVERRGALLSVSTSYYIKCNGINSKIVECEMNGNNEKLAAQLLRNMAIVRTP